jgi:hypothetical protein
MSGHCLIMADRRNSELHSGAAAFEGLDNSKWLPATYEVIEILLKPLHREFADLLGEDHAEFAVKMLEDRRNTIKKEVHEKIAAARRYFENLVPELKAQLSEKADATTATWVKANRLRRSCGCPACGLPAGMSGETVARSPVRIDEDEGQLEEKCECFRMCYCAHRASLG